MLFPIHRPLTALHLLVVFLFTNTSMATAQHTEAAIQERGRLACGVNTGLPGFANPDSAGRWQGLDVDICRAIAAAILGDGDAVQFVPLPSTQRFTALQTREIDVLSRDTTWTLTRDAELGVNFAPTTFYDGQGFLVRADAGYASALDLDGATICVQPGTTTELNLSDYFLANDMTYTPVVIERLDEVASSFFAGRCDAYTTDASALAAVRSEMAPVPEDFLILPEIISKEPLGPVVRHGDDHFLDVVQWVVFALIEAEERGVTAANLDTMRDSENPGVARLLGTIPGSGESLGLRDTWAADVVGAVGNYGEVFDRNVGVDTPLGLSRGLNDLWTRGGLMYAMPFR